MAVESAADRLSLLSTDDFGTDATIGSSTVKGIFDDAYKTVIDGQVATTSPQFLCRSADVSSVVTGTAVTINSVTYYVKEPPAPDGTGLSVLYLSRDA